MSGQAAIIGVGAIPVGRYADQLEHEMLIHALLLAMRDAAITKSDVDALVFCSPRPYTEQRYFSTFIAGYLEFPLRELLVEVVGDGMTGALALDYAVKLVEEDDTRIAIALGVSRELHVPTDEHMQLTLRAVGDVDFHAPFGVTPIAWYAMNATRYMHEYGATRADLGAVAVKNRRHAMANPLAHFRSPLSIEDVLNARPIVRPLHLFDVPPRSDGAVAIVVASAARARQLRRDPIYIVGRGFFHEGIHQIPSTPRSLVWLESAERAARAAYEAAGLGPEDIDVAEIYAPCTIVEVMVTEALGFFPAGEGVVAAVAGQTAVGGRIPVCTSGGCLSRGHPPMVTPLYNAYEAVLQLRGEAGDRQVDGARIALVTGELGDYNATLLHLLATEAVSR